MSSGGAAPLWSSKRSEATTLTPPATPPDAPKSLAAALGSLHVNAAVAEEEKWYWHLNSEGLFTCDRDRLLDLRDATHEVILGEDPILLARTFPEMVTYLRFWTGSTGFSRGAGMPGGGHKSLRFFGPWTGAWNWDAEAAWLSVGDDWGAILATTNHAHAVKRVELVCGEAYYAEPISDDGGVNTGTLVVRCLGLLFSWAMAKRKPTVTVDEEDLNDGSGSEDSAAGYVPRNVVQRLHNMADEATTITTTGRTRVIRSAVATPASPPKKRAGVLNPDAASAAIQGPDLGHDWSGDFTDFDAEYGPGIDAGPRALRDSDDPQAQWARDQREQFLDELLRQDGRGDSINQVICASGRMDCGAPAYRCSDCLHPCLYCRSCIASDHQRMPFHHVEKWEAGFFRRCSLKSLGVRIQLGHPPGVACANPEKAWGDDFVVIGSHTIDEVGLDYCNCGTAQEKTVQLLRMRLYPATGTNPRSAATFACLRRFAHMTLESKCSAYEFYNSLAREGNNTGLDPSRARYEEFVRMTRQWQHLLLLKRAGRAHDPAEDRIEVPPEKRFLYALFLAIDANFRLKRKDVSSEERDPGLSQAKYWDEVQERSTCVPHDAVDKPDRESRGTASSGIGTVDCARHNMKCPNGVGDLQRGERYLNMDYMVFMSRAGSMLLWLFISYDIACQWYKNLWTRMEKFPEDVRWTPDPRKKITFLVPKFHLPAHIEQCNIDFSFNLTPFVGQTDGEAPERGWADANRLANSTSISGPGAWRDTLDAHFQYSNWKKITKLGTALLEKMQKNVPLMVDSRAAWVDVEASFSTLVVKAWTAMAVAWEENHANPNPFASTVKRDDLRDVRLKLAGIAQAEKDHDRIRGDMHETEMLSMALQLEQQQRALATHMMKIGSHETVDQQRTRELFMPEVAVLREREDTARKRVAAAQPLPGIRAQDMPLWLPSAIGGKARCDDSLKDYEFQLRHGQAVQALDEMRGALLLRTYEWRYRDGVHGVKAKMRSKTRVDGIQARIDSAAADYRAARAALAKLGPRLDRRDWEAYLKPLKAEDVRGRPKATFGDEERRRGGRKKRQRLETEEQPEWRKEENGEMSWIWLVEGRAGVQEDVVHNEPLRIEWAETRAMAMRYAEVELLEEEMRRVLQFLDWRAGWWMSLVGLRAERQADAALREGHAAYARKQSWYMTAMREGFAHEWRDVGRFLDLTRAEYASMEADEEGSDGTDS
ncbi:hypothetical protein C8R45DRAFT_1147586 [Mycena sanguinolenta]|nr:hypothetical protein C8R45DRAFT_1147586 [Mycena sanguinolenta]